MKPQRILVVDDEALILLVWRDALKKYTDRWQVETAGSGPQALSIFAAASFDLVVTDIRMPQMDGYQLTEAIRRLDGTVPVIWITAFPEAETETRAQSLSVYRCLAKPLTLTQIRHIVSEVLDPDLARN